MSKIWILGRTFKYDFIDNDTKCPSLDTIGDSFKELLFEAKALASELQNRQTITLFGGYENYLKFAILDTETLDQVLNIEVEMDRIEWFLDEYIKEIGKLYFNLNDNEIRKLFFELKLESINDLKDTLVKKRRKILSSSFTYMFENKLKGSYFKEFSLELDKEEVRNRMIDFFYYLREREIV